MPPETEQTAHHAGAAVGDMFFSFFGAIWISVAVVKSTGWQWLLLGPVWACGAGLFWWAMQVRRRFAPQAAAPDPQQEKANALFHWINAGQWILILIVANVLNNIGLQAWILPMATLVIGAHFLPLARLFGSRRHFWLGGLMMAWALLYPLILAPQDFRACIVPGVLLWGFALAHLVRSTASTR